MCGLCPVLFTSGSAFCERRRVPVCESSEYPSINDGWADNILSTLLQVKPRCNLEGGLTEPSWIKLSRSLSCSLSTLYLFLSLHVCSPSLARFSTKSLQGMFLRTIELSSLVLDHGPLRLARLGK